MTTGLTAAIFDRVTMPAPFHGPQSAAMNDITGTLKTMERGDGLSAEQLLSLVYDELRRLAAFRMSKERPGQTLQPTALVHEAWLKLVSSGTPDFQNRTHFFSLAAEAMRRILIDRARRRQARRHGGGCEHVELDECGLAAPDGDEMLLAVSEALERLAVNYPVQAQVVKLRYFGGMTNVETAGLLDLSVSTVKNYWTFARAWLFKEIKGE